MKGEKAKALSRIEELEKAVQSIIADAEKMTKEEHVAQFKKVGIFTEEGTLSPQYSGLSALSASTG